MNVDIFKKTIYATRKSLTTVAAETNVSLSTIYRYLRKRPIFENNLRRLEAWVSANRRRSK